MVKTVFLSEPARAALDRAKQPGESDSEAVLRLIDEARSKRKDPRHFIRSRKFRKRVWTPEQHLEILDKMRAAVTQQARRTDSENGAPSE